MNSETAEKKLDSYIKTRNKIAHGQKNDESDRVNKSYVEKCLNHIETLVDKTESAIEKYVENLIEQDTNK